MTNQITMENKQNYMNIHFKSSMNKIIRIEATNKVGKHYIWSASMLLWDCLPNWLLQAIEMELPDYQLEITYK